MEIEKIEQSLNDLIKHYYLIMIAEENANNVDKNAQEAIKTDSKIITPSVAKRFKLVTDRTIENELNSVNKFYQKWFWKILCKFNGLDRILPQTIEKLLNNGTINILHLLENEKIVKQYGPVIARYLIANLQYVNQMVFEFLGEENKNNFHYYFPKELTNKDKNDMVERYIDSGNANLNTLYLLFTFRNNDQLPLSPKIRLKARKKHQEKEDEIIKTGACISNGVEITFKDQNETVSIRLENFYTRYSYDIKWVLQNLDYPTLFNNFIYLFNYTDLQFRWLHISKKSMIGTIEKNIAPHGKKGYLHSIVHNSKEMDAQSQLAIYRSLLKNSGVCVEDMIYWFFNNYLPNEFNAKGFVYNKPSNEANLLELCRSIAIEIESILKQFKLFCEFNEIDRELFEFHSEHMLIQNIPSIISRDKYIYPVENKIGGILNSLFSDQAIILCNPGTGSYEKLYRLLLRGDKICYSELEFYQQKIVDDIIKNDILGVDSKQNIVFSKKLLLLLHDLYENEFQCLNYMDEFHSELQFLKEKGFITLGKSLLSIPEQNYFNYIFNSSEFDNSMDLRNKYAHGNQSQDETVMFNDYITMLRMMILIIIKINEEFWLKDEENKTKCKH